MGDRLCDPLWLVQATLLEAAVLSRQRVCEVSFTTSLC